MYGSNQIIGAAGSSTKLQAAAQGTLGGTPPVPNSSEINLELDALHSVIGRLEGLRSELRMRLAPVSAPIPDNGCSAGPVETVPASDVGRTIRGAGQRVNAICYELQEAIDLLRC